MHPPLKCGVTTKIIRIIFMSETYLLNFYGYSSFYRSLISEYGAMCQCWHVMHVQQTVDKNKFQASNSKLSQILLSSSNIITHFFKHCINEHINQGVYQFSIIKFHDSSMITDFFPGHVSYFCT
jgi:hypothetical protein